MASTLRKMPRRGWWCPTCDQVTFERNAREREDYHAHGWGRDGVSKCPGRFQPVTITRGHEPVAMTKT